jgi:hypothetical protein
MREYAYRNLSLKLCGNVITSASTEYEVARRVYNQMIDRRPEAIPDAAIEVYLKYGQQLPTLLSTMHIYPTDGAASRVDRHATAFNYRDAKWSMVIVGVDPEPANAKKATAWAKDYWTALRPFSLGGAYVNFMMEEGIDRVKATYR